MSRVTIGLLSAVMLLYGCATPRPRSPSVPSAQKILLEEFKNSDVSVLPVLGRDDLLRNRNAEGRRAALQASGAGPEQDAAVRRALTWLQQQQREDGAWDSPNPVAVTSLALLAYLGYGVAPTSEPFGGNVRRAAAYLEKAQTETGAIGELDVQTGPYQQALAVMALAEYALHLGEPKRLAVLERAIAVMLEGQQDGGGWHYGYKGSDQHDTSITGCQIEALSVARWAVFKSETLEPALLNGVRNLVSVQDAETGRFGYQFKRMGSNGVTGSGIYALQLTGHTDRLAYAKGLMAMDRMLEDWDRSPKWPLFAGYVVAQAVYQYGGKPWSDLYAAVWNQVKPRQHEQGYWDPPAGESKYGRAYATALCALILETPYRYPRLTERSAPLMWTFSAGEASVRLIGTVPLGKEDMYLLDDRVIEQLQAADRVLIEMDARSAGRHLAERALYPKGDELAAQIPRDLFQRTADYLKAGGLRSPAVNRLKPWAAALLVMNQAQASEGVSTDRSLQAHLLDRVPGQRVHILLEPEDPARRLERLPEAAHAQLLAHALEEADRYSRTLRTLRRAWRRAENGKIEHEIQGLINQPQWAEFRRPLLDASNRLILERIEAQFAAGGQVFVILDASRLFGEEGLLRLLKEKNLHPEPVSLAGVEAEEAKRSSE